MKNSLRTILKGQSAKLGVIAGLLYGIFARYVAETQIFGDAFTVMSLAFLVLVPMVLGFLTVSSAVAPSLVYRIFAPWVPALLGTLAAAAIGWEGAICIALGLPLILFFASIGGIFGGLAAARRTDVRAAILVVPLLTGSLERHVAVPARLTETVTRIHIDAPPAVVWPLVVSVDSIRPEEQHRALFTRLGFPHPISATISGAGVGAVRRARFEHGLVFTETVTDWQPERRLSFTIRPNTDSIPPTTLDRHVTVGGPFFDVLTGTYELTPTKDGQGTELVLRSEHRVSTRFNLYAGWWVDRIMGSIQRNILAVHKSRAERGSRVARLHQRVTRGAAPLESKPY